MSIKEEITSIVSLPEASFKEKGSLFIGKAFPIETEDEFETKLLAFRKEYYDATHHCFAYKLKDDQFRYSDAGEPNGTAGIRIYNAIEHFNLYDVGVIVVRYFGGTKLGVGPLGKAYYKSAEEVLASAVKVIKKPFKKIAITTGFDYISTIHHYLPLFNAVIVNVDYSNVVSFIVEINSSSTKKLRELLIVATNGNVELSESEEIFYRTI